MKKIFLTLLLLFSPLAMADVATVVASRGEVITENRPLQSGSKISVGDHIITGHKSFAILQFVDGAKVTIRPNSELVVSEYDYSEDGNAELELVSGGLRVITGRLAKNNTDNYKIKTPVALMGVRGTEFSLMVCGNDMCQEELE